jgi:hypothetical protein
VEAAEHEDGRVEELTAADAREDRGHGRRKF